MTALLCLLAGVAALVLTVVLPGQRLYLGLLAIVAGAAAALLAPAARGRPDAVTTTPTAPADSASTGSEEPQGAAMDAGPWERATGD